MNEFVVEGALPLEEGGMLVIEDGREMLVYVWKGTVWVTQDGSPEDRVLSRGEWMRIERGGKTILSALAPSAVALTSPVEEHCASAITVTPRSGASPTTLYRGQPKSAVALLDRLARLWDEIAVPAGRVAAY